MESSKLERLHKNLELRQRRWAEKARAFEAWRSIRRGPPACLKCRSTNFFLPDSHWADLPHEPCGGILKASATLWAGTSMRTWPHQYSPEGDLLTLGSQTIQQIGEFREEPLELW
jgi:hypothetical protein